ncbi:transketolase [Tistrella mobilis]|uniref:transketolase n=1 Tax=Tistrella mobilis TaxID=171437 RepID=UPI0031F683FA
MTAQTTDATATTAPTPRDMANAVRALAMDAVERANSGHPGMPMGMADAATVLFTRFLKFDPKAPKWADRDRFVLSAGHGSMLLYALLHLTGYEDMTLDEVKNFRQLGARTAGHPEYGHASGIETTTGPLGQGIANAVGMALAERLLAARFGGSVVDHYTYVIAGDGCLMEGISQEAISLAGHLKLSKLIVLWDDNGISIDGPVSLSSSEDQRARFEAAGWATDAVDGHDAEAVAAALDRARSSDKPVMIACRTVIGYGAPKKAGTSGVHGAALGAEEIAGTREALAWPHAPFEIPADIRTAWAHAGARGAAERAAWEQRLGALDAGTQAEFTRAMAGELPAGWKQALDDYIAGLIASPKTVATRKASEMALEVLVPAIPELIGGSADLTGSNNTRTKGMKPVAPGEFDGRYVFWGIREHGMAAAMNGMALHGGVIPYGGTFLVFTDYCRPSIRLSALMEQRVIYVMTHDSIGLGEDGPTHQPVEHLMSLRMMPNVAVMRPADVVETAECWAAALERTNGPSVLALSRQNLKQLRLEASAGNLSAKGAYILREASAAPEAVLLATGSEVEIAVAAAEALEAKGVPTRVVSMPCWELFAAQPADYQAQVLGGDVVRIAIEAGIGFGWERWTGPKGAVIGMTGFGASAPAPELYRHFGITAEAVVDAALARV